MSWLTDIFSSGAAKVVDSVASGLDNLFTSDEEKLLLRNKLSEAMNDFKLDMERVSLQREQELTKRLQADMASDSWLSKNVRPMILLFLTGVLFVLSVTDGNIKVDTYTFAISKEWIDLYKYLLMTAYGFYFGSRGAEKVSKIIKYPPGGQT